MNRATAAQAAASPLSGISAHRLLAFAFVVTLVPLASAQAPGVAPGQATERVVTLADANQSYAVYLPSTYDPQKKWPVVFGFDPGARGPVPVEVFRAAAEKHGYILVGSNNAQNGPRRLSLEAFAAILGDVEKRFSVDPDRYYAAGFSGGARVAGLTGFLCKGCIRAVIACGPASPTV
ncbi:MAG: hypothetical protein ACRD3A_02410 [Terriglobales bacterium]